MRHYNFSNAESNFRLFLIRYCISVFVIVVVNISQIVLYLVDHLSCTVGHHNLLAMPGNHCGTKHPDCFPLACRLCQHRKFGKIWVFNILNSAAYFQYLYLICLCKLCASSWCLASLIPNILIYSREPSLMASSYTPHTNLQMIVYSSLYISYCLS